MSQPVNLNKFRKARAKADKAARADANAVKFGRTKAEKDAAQQRAAASERKLDGHKREP